MAQEWLRLYRRTVNNPKLQKLGLEAVGFWTNCLCLSDDDGYLPNTADIAWAMRVSETEAETFLVTFQRNRLVLKDEHDRYRLHDWDEHQKRSDVSTDRVRKFREKRRKLNETADETSGETTGNVSETAQSREEKSIYKKENSGFDQTTSVSSKSKSDDDPSQPLGSNWIDLTPTDPTETEGWPKSVDLQIAARFWNDKAAGELGLPEVRALTRERSKHLSARLREIGSLGEWFAAVNAIRAQPFLTGRNDRQWRANFDWFIKPSNFSKVIEQTYERSNANGHA